MAATVARYAGSGNIVDVHLPGGIDGFGVRCRIGIALGVPLDRVRLVSLVTQDALPNSSLVPAEISVCLLAIDQQREEAAEQQLVQLIGQFDGTANMEELVAAESLDLSALQVAYLPETFARLRCLARLWLEHNELTSLPATFHQLTDLRNVCLSFNRLTHLPDTFGWLRQLETFRVDNNQLSTLPDTFGQLWQLRQFLAHDNNLIGLPANFGQLWELQDLNLRFNQLQTLPDSFPNLWSLTICDISGNFIKYSQTLDQCTRTLPNLLTLDVEGRGP